MSFTLTATEDKVSIYHESGSLKLTKEEADKLISELNRFAFNLKKIKVLQWIKEEKCH